MNSEAVQAAYDKLIEYQLSYRPFQTPESMAKQAQRERERQAKLEMSFADAMGEWEDLFRRTNDVGKSVLDVHTPGAGYSAAICAACWAPNEYDDAVESEWPCTTFIAVREASWGTTSER